MQHQHPAVGVQEPAAGLTGAGDVGCLRGTAEADAGERDDERRRAWTDEFGTITDSGRAARAQIEDATDRVSASSFDEEAQARTITPEEPLVSAARAIEASGAMQFPNPVGVRAP